jgi:hypothetical protein
VLKVDGITLNIITNFGKSIGKYLALFLVFRVSKIARFFQQITGSAKILLAASI